MKDTTMSQKTLFNQIPWYREAQISTCEVFRHLSEMTDEQLLSGDRYTMAYDTAYLCCPMIILDFDRISVCTKYQNGVQKVQVRIPFSGDPSALDVRPTNPPEQTLRGRVTKKYLELEVTHSDSSPESLWSAVGNQVKLADEYYLAYIDDAVPLKAELEQLADLWVGYRINVARESLEQPAPLAA